MLRGKQGLFGEWEWSIQEKALEVVVQFLRLPFSLSLLEGGHMNLADRTKIASASLVGLTESTLVRFLFAVVGYHLEPTQGDGVLGCICWPPDQ